MCHPARRATGGDYFRPEQCVGQGELFCVHGYRDYRGINYSRHMQKETIASCPWSYDSSCSDADGTTANKAQLNTFEHVNELIIDI